MSAISSNARALLDIIAKAEGTYGPQGYNTMFTGKTFEGFGAHPRQIQRSSGHASDAAGRYQFLSTTWDETAKRLGLTDFSPQSQDLAALDLVRRRGLNPDEPLTREGLAKLAPEWASLPTMEGKSYYNQPVKNADELLKAYQSKAQGGSGGSGQPAAPPTSLPGAGGQPATLAAGLPGMTPIQGGDPAALAGQILAQTAGPRNRENPFADAAISGLDGLSFRPAGSRGFRSELQRSAGPMAAAQAGFDAQAVAAAALAGLGGVGGGAAQMQQVQAPGAQMQQGGGGGQGALKVGRIADPSEDVFPTTGAHLDVRIKNADGSYTNPEHARSLLANLRVGGKPLYEQNGDDWRPSAPVTSRYGPRTAPAPGASTYHRGVDFGIAAHTPLEWHGGGDFSWDGGVGKIRLADGRTVKLLHTRPS